MSDLASHCIRCGFCLESCPTFKVTGEETESPRGRIYLARSADEGKLDWADVAPHLDLCLGCRACETACPSGVEYGQILEMARAKLVEKGIARNRKPMLQATTNPTTAKLQFAAAGLLPGRKVPGFLNQVVGGSSQGAYVPKPMKAVRYPPLDESLLPPIRGEVALLEGCAMGVLFAPVHEATVRLLRRIGYRTHMISGACCGALHAHAGYLQEAQEKAKHLASKVPKGMPILTNSAGCGSTMKEYGLLNSNLQGFGERVQDVSEFLLASGLLDELKKSTGLRQKLTYHDACHLAHGQRLTSPPRQLLHAIPNATWVELEDSQLCCGSAGIYSALQPVMAQELLGRKWRRIAETGAEVLVQGNPGCHAWIEQGPCDSRLEKVRVLHTAQVLEASFLGVLPG